MYNNAPMRAGRGTCSKQPAQIAQKHSDSKGQTCTLLACCWDCALTSMMPHVVVFLLVFNTGTTTNGLFPMSVQTLIAIVVSKAIETCCLLCILSYMIKPDDCRPNVWELHHQSIFCQARIWHAALELAMPGSIELLIREALDELVIFSHFFPMTLFTHHIFPTLNSSFGEKCHSLACRRW
jgi:hypothetical protein